MTVAIETMNGAQILELVRAGKLDMADLKLPQLRLVFAEQEREKAEAEKVAAEQASFGIKIGRSGTVSVTGFGRYGISLYVSQWMALFPLIPAIARFIKAYATLIQARVDAPLAENSPNDFKALKLKADSQFTTPTE